MLKSNCQSITRTCGTLLTPAANRCVSWVWTTLALLAALAVAIPTQAAMMNGTWIVRSEVAANHSMLGPGFGGSINAADKYHFESWPFRGGFEWQVTLDPGTLAGNVEGLLEATYDNYLADPGTTSIGIGYSGLNDESRVDGTIEANVSIKPYFGANIFGAWVDTALPISVVDANMNTHADFTTGLGVTRATDAQDHQLLELGGEVLLISYGFDIHAVSKIEFRPRMLSGLLTYEHIDTGAKYSTFVDFSKDEVLNFDLNLDREGHWLVSLEEFYLEQCDFRTEFGFGFGIELGVPLLGSSVGVNGDITVHDTGYFTPKFTPHLDGAPVGQFMIYVAPEPSTLGLMSLTLLATLRRKSR